MKKIILPLFVLCIALVSCSKDEAVQSTSNAIAKFNVVNTNGVVNERSPLLLENNSTDAVSYLWDFGNGKISTEKTPSYTYPMCGNYHIKLTVTDSKGNVNTLEKDMPVLCIYGGANHSSSTSAN